MQQNLGSHELTSPNHFWPCPPKKHCIPWHCIAICTSMQKVSVFHMFIFEMNIKSILKSHDQTGLTHFRPWSLKKYLICFYFLWICINMQKISSSVCSFFRYSPSTRLPTPIFDHAHPKMFLSPFNLHEFVPACKTSVNTICSFLS